MALQETFSISNSKKPVNFQMGFSASKADSYEDDMKSYFRETPSLRDMAIFIQEESKFLVSIISDAIKSNRGIRNDQELYDLVDQFFALSNRMSAFCNEIESCLNKVSDSLLILRAAVQRFKEGRSDGALEDLEKFLNSENPFTDLPEKLENVLQQQEQLAEKLKLYNNKIKKKLGGIMIWRIAAGLIFISMILTLATCKIYRLILMPLLLGAASVTSVMIPAWKVLDKQCKSYYDGLERKQYFVGLMKERGFIEKTNLEEIKMAAEKTGNLLQSLKGNAQFTLEGEEKVKIGFEHIENRMDYFAKSIEKSGECVEKCSEDLKKGREEIKIEEGRKLKRG